MEVIITNEISILDSINEKEVSTIFSNSKNIKEFLNLKNIQISKTISNSELYKTVINNWNYEIDSKIIREMYKKTEKYINSKKAKENLSKYIEIWNKNFDENITWPFSANQFDAYVARLNRREELSEKQKDDELFESVKKFRLIKQINTCRNDYIENLIFKFNENIVPTLKHNKSVDFFIDGIMFDQKVSKSLGKDLKRMVEKDENYLEVIKKDLSILAKWMYENQDVERFDSDYRLYVIFNDNFTTGEELEEKFYKQSNNLKPIDIEFTYVDKVKGEINHYRTKCIVIFMG